VVVLGPFGPVARSPAELDDELLLLLGRIPDELLALDEPPLDELALVELEVEELLELLDELCQDELLDDDPLLDELDDDHELEELLDEVLLEEDQLELLNQLLEDMADLRLPGQDR